MEPSSAPWRVIEPEPAPEDTPSPPDGNARDLPWVAIGAVLIAVAIAVAAFLLAARPDPGIEVDGAMGTASGSVAEGGTGAADPDASSGAVTLVVEVGGAVARPGVYRLAAGSRVMDAVEAAGGFGPRVDAALADRRLNLAAPLRDGDEVHVPVRGEAPSGDAGTTAGGSGSGPGAGGGPVDLNHASAEALDTLPGVGPATAAKIIAAREERPFATVDELGSRKVVGPATLEKLRPLVVVTP
ncbi:MAG TPA: ComEA family DNA-binding protein [Candidatus Limnocylindrales bacterium]|nr:ComEA family DNA-binding protein [Candidatus Limnocylindrales bacterium]